jgi:uncharacterized membrane protein YcaP (DUF421 family)
MEYIIAILKTIFFYFFVVLIYRMMGKREVGQLSIIDLIISILIAELIAISIDNANDPILLSVIPITILFLFQIIFAYISLKSNNFKNIFDGKPAIIIKYGKLDFKSMIKNRYNLDDLLMQLREKGIKSIDEVEYAILENNGKLSIFKYNLFKIASNYPMPLILDGDIQEDTLKIINKNKHWLYEMLNKENVDLKNVFYAFYKSTKIYVIKKNELK